MSWRLLLLPFTPRLVILTLSVVGFAVAAAATRGEWSSAFTPLTFVFVSLCALGLRDLLQTEHAILRAYPISGHLRFLFETIRPELRQYFFEGNRDGRPFSRDRRAIVYQRAKMAIDKRPFGAEIDVYEEGYEWLRHSIAARPVSGEDFRTRVGAARCARPYDISLLNISAMSFGALGANAVAALNLGARKGGFAQDTGEGGFSPYHRQGGDIVWQIASGYFGCRTEKGAFDPEKFAAVAADEQIRMIEVKLSQGAKPGHGGVLPGAKVTAEIARIRGVPQGEDCVSPATHSAFSTPIELLQFLERLRALSGGKPVGFKLCLGQPAEFLAICKAMVETKLAPDFIVVDGKEGGTGSAPMEFMDHVGMPMREGLVFAHHALIGVGLRDSIRIGAAGQIVTAFDMARALALGADWCNSGRGFMFALGCIQSQSCHTDRCPTGVATQDKSRGRALVVADKAERVRNFHRATMIALAELAAAAGLDHPNGFEPEHFCRRVSAQETASFADLHPAPAPGSFLAGEIDARFSAAWRRARAESFRPAATT
ncbi:FMN-binding glutamate synthase family protein [Methylosinus sp. Sm6]|uniref:FMN-binding glutamate synthase family protein n=1 Tax=Methylosinus sp. Sm6 TaxID=2866948 RepID=UPI001C9905EF|nr:FMN-binding glutamate synthase family protein [Methylosinus sp. Sm6]MBY6240680.1 FMN-binding glutamate synthase family protein [Methylosinus sp. Sm6]